MLIQLITHLKVSINTGEALNFPKLKKAMRSARKENFFHMIIALNVCKTRITISNVPAIHKHQNLPILIESQTDFKVPISAPRGSKPLNRNVSSMLITP
jgi:hypothetical protein